MSGTAVQGLEMLPPKDPAGKHATVDLPFKCAKIIMIPVDCQGTSPFRQSIHRGPDKKCSLPTGSAWITLKRLRTAFWQILNGYFVPAAAIEFKRLLW
jgi:hypothetical protein